MIDQIDKLRDESHGEYEVKDTLHLFLLRKDGRKMGRSALKKKVEYKIKQKCPKMEKKSNPPKWVRRMWKFVKKEKKCEACGKNDPRAKLLACARCKTALYCNRKCQKKHFKTHKLVCSPIKADT